MHTNIAKYFPNFCCQKVEKYKLSIVRDEHQLTSIIQTFFFFLAAPHSL